MRSPCSRWRAHTDGVWDVVVVGAGPAGSSAAIAALRARPGARVLLLDRADFPRDKACGDGVAPHVLEVLADLDVHGLLDDRQPVDTLELGFGGLTLVRRMRRPAWVVPRLVFDARLVDAALCAGAELCRHQVRRVETRPDRVVIDGRIEARVAIAADGAHSVVRAAVCDKPPHHWALALRCYAPTAAGHGGRQVIRFGQSRRPSYAWSFDRGDGWSNVGYGEVLRGPRDAPTRRLMVGLLEDLLPGAVSGAVGWRAHHLPLSTGRWRQPDGRVLLAGDAASLVNPLTGEGIYYAVASGTSAGRAAVHATGDAGAVHRTAMRRLLSAHLASTTATQRLVKAPGVLPAGLRAARADQGVFDDLVEMGLGRGLLTPRILRGLMATALPPPMQWSLL
jgi:geranylgeranyl reductase family protein